MYIASLKCELKPIPTQSNHVLHGALVFVAVDVVVVVVVERNSATHKNQPNRVIENHLLFQLNALIDR